MKFGLPISFALHGLVAFGGVLLWSGHVEQLAQTHIIPLELVTVSDITDIQPTRSKDVEPEEKPEEKPEITPETIAPETGQPPIPKSEPAPVFDLDELEKAFKDVRKDNPDAGTQKTLTNEAPNADIAENERQGVGAGTDAIVNAKDYIRSRMKDCWNVDTGAMDYQDLAIKVDLTLNMDGSIANIKVTNNAQIIASANKSWAVARYNATTALRKCAPYDGLLNIDYDVWKELKLHLDPGEN